MTDNFSSDIFFQPLKEMLSTRLGLNLGGASAETRSESHIVVGRSRPVPTLHLMFKQNPFDRFFQNGEKYGIIENELRADIRDCWRETVTAVGLDKEAYYDSKMYFFAVSFDNICSEVFARNRKADVSMELLMEFSVKPRVLYASSSPGLTIIFETFDYERFSIESKADAIKEHIKKLAADFIHGKYGPEVACTLSVRILHPGMKEYHGYFLSRED